MILLIVAVAVGLSLTMALALPSAVERLVLAILSIFIDPNRKI